MNKRDLQNQKLDRIGRKLLEATKMQSEELDRIVAAPQLFDSVKARIKVEQNKRESNGFFDFWRNFQFWNRQKSFAVSTALTVLFFAALCVVLFVESPRQVEQAFVPQVQMQTEASEIQQFEQVFNDSPEIPVIKKTAIRTRTNFNQAKVEKINFKTPGPARKPKIIKKQTPVEAKEPNREFYALAHGAPIEANEGLQIIRAELPRSSVFALGVNIPIENESEKIKTDLLVGADGVARAIRFVD
ncbi:MAG TPA: hypothetical protein VF556_06645 [Pyrinomonadaceae bacterium]|jgi:hypothetical protein